jgi:hypothetical protein
MKKRREWWFPKTHSAQRAMFANIRDKIAGYKNALPFPTEKIARMQLICDTFLAVNDYTEQTRATAQSLTDWQNLIYDGGDGFANGAEAPAAPLFTAVTLPAGAFVNIFEDFKRLVDDIKHADNYTEGIGEDLMIVPPEGEDLLEDELHAELKSVQAIGGYKIRLDASLQGMSAVRVEYWAKDASIPQVDKFTKFPAVMTIYPKTAGEPEAGRVRATLLKDNEPVGLPSPEYPVTLSA